MPANATAKYDAIAAAYDEGYRGAFWEVYDDLTWRAATRGLRPGSRVLDAGAGSGKWAARFMREGHEVTLLDPSEGMLSRAREKLAPLVGCAEARFVTAGIERMPLPDGSFDLVFCEGDPLSYVGAAREQAARELVRVLTPGGRLYVSCDNRWLAAFMLLATGASDAGLAAGEQGRARDPYGVEVHAFSPSELGALLEAAGLSDVRVTGKVGLLHLLPPAAREALLRNPAQRERLLALERTMSDDPAVAGLASHLHAVGWKA